ncbi:uncharacterized protein A1O9_02466 [Exophiala aquamarina CBS 119918]|uniref:Asp/Glu/hydantoin racemase n=1 Tax=Exophiala aquamarina CBS 119918 TaxID=1182545 RepID=A0A072PMD1_9EURO|nr:uncharacterized protein A1O9_02466 [Exophiala aquamarina CBS 119918]KEF60902.1 hypothetical protein A1O9_02466 [Exophiala aquamarina CBS 119918]
MARQLRIGILVPSSNTILEPLISAILSSIQSEELSISVHFSRFRVTTIDLTHNANAQFELGTILSAARLLADAHVNVIGWGGTSAGWLGFEVDERLCAVIEAETKIPATTSTLALNQLLSLHGVKALGLVTPYLEEINDRISRNYLTAGIAIEKSRENHLGITDNNKIVMVDEGTLDRMVQEVVDNGAHVVTTFCTNLRAAQRVEYWEKTHGIIVLDTVSTVVWGVLKIVGVNTGLVKGWGRIFE